MKNNGRVQGSKEWAKPIVVYPDCVYIHKNIKEIEDSEGNTMYEYNEIVYDHDEYIMVLQEQVTSLQKAMVTMFEGGKLT